MFRQIYYTVFISLCIFCCNKNLTAQTNPNQKASAAYFNSLLNKVKLNKQLKNSSNNSIELLLEAKSIAKQINDSAKMALVHISLADIYYWGTSDYFKCKLELDTLGKHFFNSLSNNQKCKYLSQYGDAIYYDGEYVQSVEYYYRALNYVDNDSIMLARLYHNLGWVYTDLEKYEKGIEFGQKALQVALKTNKGIAHKMEGLVYIYKTAKQYPKALEYQNKLAQFDTSKSQTGFNYYQKSSIYADMKQLDSAMYFGELAIKIAMELHLERQQKMYISQQLDYSLKAKKITVFNNYLPVYEKLALKYDKYYELDATYNSLGEYYIQMKELDKARHYLTLALKLAENYKRDNIENIYKSLSNYYSKVKDYNFAYYYLEKYQIIKDSLFDKEKVKTKKAIDNFHKIFDL